MTARGLLPFRTPTRHALRAATAGAAVLALSVAGCQSTKDSAQQPTNGGGPGTSESPSSAPSTPVVPKAQIAVNVENGADDVTVDTALKVTAAQGKLSTVKVESPKGKPLAGSMNANGTAWTAASLLEPGRSYRVDATAKNSAGVTTRQTTRFHSEDLTLDEQTYPSIAPLRGETVGVGMPAIVQFDVPVTNRASIERHLSVTSTAHVAGSWHWVSDQEVHWRPKHFWPSGTRVTVKADINSIPAGNGIYGQMNRSTSFVVGDSVIDKINIATDEMNVYINGSLARTIPVTGGMPGWDTRSGTKLIVEKFLSRRMDAATVGISPSSPDYYNIPDVQYAMRVTYSGEFLHAAPWSEYAQGSYNVSHGCVGMSTENAAWLFNLSHRGDVVQVTGTSRGLEDGNGWTDWNMSFKEYKQGSALS
jgi:lipoprotein-anchoring transpeptidase ErfK/SrfK